MMGIREEMLEAYDASRAALVKWRDSVEDDRAEFYGGELNGLLRALCILDEWELVLEGQIWESEDDAKDYVAAMVTRHFKPGDRIAIYTRK